MLVSIKRQVLDSLDDVRLIWTCIEPTILQIRGRNFTVKSEVYMHLTNGQRALLMFQMLYGHTSNGIVEFLCHGSYLLSRKGVWAELKNGMQHFGDCTMMQLLGEMESVYRNLYEGGLLDDTVLHDTTIGDIEKDPNLVASMGRLETRFYEILPATIELIGEYIRHNPDEFVQVEA